MLRFTLNFNTLNIIYILLYLIRNKIVKNRPQSWLKFYEKKHFSSGISSGKNVQLRQEPESKSPDPASEPESEPAPMHP